ncbi:MAG: methyltransferase [Terriglobia bacterium]|jgi:(2Fe-2S) ferredoxin/2-polyprenyl-3-methyl-5-hydroxy-6-metoxy-1,4-benzoquinol methylase
MEPFRLHVFVCDQKKPEGVPCCSGRGSEKVIDALRREVAARGLDNGVQITVCGSFGLCERGPNMVVYPEGVWYSAVAPEDVSQIVREHFQEGRVVARLANTDEEALRHEIASNRDKMRAALRAKDQAGALPDEWVQMVRGYQESRVILTAVELDIFTAVGHGAAAAEVAGRIQADPRATEMLMNALVAMGLLSKQEGIFRNSPAASRYFVAGSRDDARLATLHTVHTWRRWSTLTECVRAGTSVTYQEMSERGEEWARAFIAAMHRNAAERAPLVVQAVGVEGVRRMLDVGGGSAAYSIAFARASAELQAEILDLPTVLPIAESHIQDAGLAGRIRTRAGDLRTNELGEGYDLVLVSAICHMLDPEENRELIRRCFAGLAPKGRIVVQDFILEPDKTAPKFAALFSLNMLVGTRAGSSYSEGEYAAWLREAGFGDVRHLRLPGPSSLMIGRRRA